jgi:hypothetical protein
LTNMVQSSLSVGADLVHHQGSDVVSEAQIESLARTGGPSGPAIDSLDIVLTLTRQQFVAQQTYTGALDAKAGFILGSASLLTGVLAVWQTPKPADYSLLTQLIGGAASSIVQLVPLTALVIYLIVVVTSYAAYVPFKFVEVPDPNRLASVYKPLPAGETKEAVLSATLAGFNQNGARLKVKAFRVRLAFGALLAEAIVVAALLSVGHLH